MPDLPTRKKREEEIEAALLLLFLSWKEQFADSEAVDGLSPPDYARLADDVAVAVAPVLVIVHAEGAAQLANQTGFVTDEEKIWEKSEKWANQRGKELGKQVAQTTAAGFLAGKTAAEVFSADRAELIAVSEVTDAITIGEALVLLLLWDEQGRTFEAFWYTKDDEKVCVICGPLHRKPRAVWILVVPTGPKAHPICRCWLEYQEIFNA